MPIQVSVIPQQRLILMEGEGALGERELVEARQETIRHPEFEATFSVLMDFRNVTKLSVTPTFLRDRASSPFVNAPGRVAVVVSQSVHYGFVRMYSAYLLETRAETRPFYDLDEARQWLGLADC